MIENSGHIDLLFALGDILSLFQEILSSDQLVDGTHAQPRHIFAQFLCDKAHEVDDVLGLAHKAFSQLGVLRCYAEGAGVEVADAHHRTAQGHQRRGRKAEFLRTEDRRDRDVATCHQLAVCLNDDLMPQSVEQERLVRFGKTELPRKSRVIDRAARRGACSAVIA